MGRKSSAKAQTRASSVPPPPHEGPRKFPALPVVALIAVAVAIGAFIYSRSGNQTDAAAQSAQQSQQAAPPPAAEVPEIARKAYPQAKMPPFPPNPSPPARPPEVVRAAYKFAAEHPEVLSYAPCYCGCERSGHRGNEDCFVTGRAENGDVTEWEPHGAT
jgi:hypothetical protein